MSDVVEPCFRLHPYQRQVLRDIIREVSSPEARVVAHLPTGAGKTRIAAHAASHLLNRRDDESSLLVWLASTEELCEQAAGQLSLAWKHLGQREIAVHRYWGQSRIDLHVIESGFLVTGLAKLRSAGNQDNTLLAHLASRVAGLIFDEAHQAVANTYEHIVEQLCSHRPPLIGLTATPGRTADFAADDWQLAEMFRRKKVSIDSDGYDNPVTFLIQNGYLADPNVRQIRFESDDELDTAPAGTDYGEAALRALGENERRRLKILRLVKESSERHARILVFCPSVDCAHLCADDLTRQGIESDVVTTRTANDERAAAISAFKTDDSRRRVLFNYGVLTTGFDAPKTSCVVIARPTTSLVLFSQMMGRAMRGPRARGNRRATILTVVDTNLPGFASVAEAFTNWEKLWTQD